LSVTVSGSKTDGAQPAGPAGAAVIQTRSESSTATFIPAGDGPISGPVIQREEFDTTVSPGTGHDSQAEDELDLDKVARQIYPLIKRMMAIERDRQASR
jgi:hypothetical protein